MKKIFILLLFACNKESPENGNLAIYNLSKSVIVDSVKVNNVIYKKDIGNVREVFPVGPAAGTVRIYLSKVIGQPVITFKDSKNHSASVQASPGFFNFSYFMALKEGGYIATITIPE